MRTIYIDSDYRCHTDNAEGRTAVQTDAFDGKCDEYIEGWRFVPQGETWTRWDGHDFHGPMICPAVDSIGLERAQAAYIEQQYIAAVAAVDELLLAAAGGESA